MKIDLTYTLNYDEIKSKLHYQLIVETVGSSGWETGSNKRRLNEQFTNEEQEIIWSCHRKAYRWYSHTGIPEEVRLLEKEYSVWLKLKQYCIDNFTIYGKNKNFGR